MLHESMACDRVMTVVVFEENVLRLICGYALQSGRSFEEIRSLCMMSRNLSGICILQMI